MKANSWLILWQPVQDTIEGEEDRTWEVWFPNTFKCLRNANFNFVPIPGVWIKPAGQTNQPSIRLASTYESFVYAYKGHPSIIRQGRANSFNFSPVPPTRKSHPTERPLDMMQEILTTFGVPGSHVLVPFLGSGNTLIAATLSKMISIGFELSDSYKVNFILKIKEIFGKGGEKNESRNVEKDQVPF